VSNKFQLVLRKKIYEKLYAIFYLSIMPYVGGADRYLFAQSEIGCESGLVSGLPSNCKIQTALDQNGNCTLTGCYGDDHIYNFFAINQCEKSVSGGSFWHPNFSCTQASKLGTYYAAPLTLEGCEAQQGQNLPPGSYCNNCNCTFDAATTLLSCSCTQSGLYGYYDVTFYTNSCSGDIVYNNDYLTCSAEGQSAIGGDIKHTTRDQTVPTGAIKKSVKKSNIN